MGSQPVVLEIERFCPRLRRLPGQLHNRAGGRKLAGMRFIIATLIVFVIIASVLAQDFSVFSWTYWQDGGTTSRSEVVRNLGLLAAGIIGLGFVLLGLPVYYLWTYFSPRSR